MKVTNNRQHRKRTTTRFLAVLLIVASLASLAGCTPAFCADGSAGSTLLERMKNSAHNEIQNAKDAINEMADKIANGLPAPNKQNNTSHIEDTALLPDFDPFAPQCPPFEEELGVYYTYEKFDVFFDQDEALGLNDFYDDIYGLYIYALSPVDYPVDVLAEEFKRIYGHKPNRFPCGEMVGQFFIDGEDWVPVYKLSVEYVDATLIWYDKRDGIYKWENDNGSYGIGFEKIFGVWENTDVFDDNADCWKAYEEYITTDEYKARYQEMMDWMCQKSGMTVGEMRDDEHFRICCFMFFSNVCDLEHNVFSVMRMFCEYQPDVATEDAPATETPEEPTAD